MEHGMANKLAEGTRTVGPISAVSVSQLRGSTSMVVNNHLEAILVVAFLQPQILSVCDMS